MMWNRFRTPACPPCPLHSWVFLEHSSRAWSVAIHSLYLKWSFSPSLFIQILSTIWESTCSNPRFHVVSPNHVLITVFQDNWYPSDFLLCNLKCSEEKSRDCQRGPWHKKRKVKDPAPDQGQVWEVEGRPSIDARTPAPCICPLT